MDLKRHFCSVRLAVTWQRGELDHRDPFSPPTPPPWKEKGSGDEEAGALS